MIKLELRTTLSYQQRRQQHNSLTIAVRHIAVVFRWRYIFDIMRHKDSNVKVLNTIKI